MSPNLTALAEIVRAIPVGKVRAYGDVGKDLPNPVSGLLVGRWMGQLFEEVPWWRVIGKQGTILIFKRGPEHALRQRQLLEGEGIVFDGDTVPAEFFA